MTTYRVGTHHGVTVIRVGDGTRCDRPDHDCRRGHLVGVMLTAEDAALVVPALNAAAEGFSRWCENETNEKCSGLEALERTPSLPSDTECDCGHDGLDAMFHLRPCPVAELRAAARKLGYDLTLQPEPADPPQVEHRASSPGGDGLGYGPCVGCGELWPCKASRGERP